MCTTPNRTSTIRTVRRGASILAVALVVSACSADAATRDAGLSSAVMSDRGPTEPAENTISQGETVDPLPTDLRQRCIDSIRILDRRWEEEGFEYPDEGPELSEEELEQTMAPAQPYDDGVLGPDERPELVAAAGFDPESIPIPQLDRFAETCFEQDVVTEADVFGDDDNDEPLPD